MRFWIVKKTFLDYVSEKIKNFCLLKIYSVRCGYIDKTCSLPTYNENRYRDTAHISEYPSACDIFSLGELLNMLIILYHFYFRHDVDEILSKFKDVYKEEMALARIMKADIQKRPKNFQELKQTPEY